MINDTVLLRNVPENFPPTYSVTSNQACNLYCGGSLDGVDRCAIWPFLGVCVAGLMGGDRIVFFDLDLGHHSRLDETATAAHSVREDETRTEAGVLLLSSSGMSLVGVGFGLFRASSMGGSKQLVLTVLCVLSIALSWSVVHTVFTLRYAHEYFSQKGGIDFGNHDPTYADFAYMSFTIGMTYQVSDTQITSRRIRSTVTRQALLSYVFGTSIIAVMINVLAGIVQK